MAKVLAYIRVSTDEQALGGVSLECQEADIRDYAARFMPGLEVHVFADPGISAWKDKLYERPAGKRMRAVMASGDHVVFWKLDRGFRSVADFATITKHWLQDGINLHFVRDRFQVTSANGMLMANIFASFAQYRSDMASERKRAANKARKDGRDVKQILNRRKKKSGRPRNVDEFERQRSAAIPEIIATREPSKNVIVPGGRVFTYGRCSHDDSLRTGNGLEAQREACVRYAEWLVSSSGGALVQQPHQQDEAVSAFSMEFRRRPVGGELDRELRHGDHLVFARLDRAWRDLRDMDETCRAWEARGITVHFVDMLIDTSTAIGRLFLRIMGAMAQWESEEISERTKAALDLLRKQGRPVGFAPRMMREVTYNDRVYLAWNARCVRYAWWANHLVHNHKMTIVQAADHIERAMAIQQGRRPIPRGGVYYRLKNLRKYLPARELWSQDLRARFCFYEKPHIHYRARGNAITAEVVANEKPEHCDLIHREIKDSWLKSTLKHWPEQHALIKARLEETRRKRLQTT